MQQARRATVEDGGKIAEIQVRGWQAAYRGIIPDDYLDALDPEKRCSFWERQIRDDCGDMFVTAADGKVVGFCHLIPSRDTDGGEAAEIAAIYVDPVAWRQGCGRLLCEAAFASANLKGAPRVTLWVLADNGPGRRFYEAMGFSPDGAAKSVDGPGFSLEEVRYRFTFTDCIKSPGEVHFQSDAEAGR